MVIILIDGGADITVEDNDRYDSLKLAARGGFDEIISIFLDPVPSLFSKSCM